MDNKTCAIVIPARIGSTRLPNKPLKDIAGKTLIERVVDQARKTTAKSIHVATDSDEIMYHCNDCLLYTSDAADEP